ncbi:MAG: biopolymer transporter ExbD [candidate division Zixibacteria bacterium]|nr:biopolymer transporter ExbD [candidate division Zixibacteria bacterium]MDH3938605.1 biopolymer transporter ExbD [candidate division Zixibacteria bacterium]MDH4033896.1 biopolymer transporter ExbD [candidate division Zixibacteria bacterium]
MRRRQRTYGAVAEINIANLVDVVLVLLIIFMISAPLLQSGIEINLPKTKTAAIEKETQGVVITIDSLGGVFVNDRWASPGDLEEVVERAMEDESTSSVFIRGDSAVPYGTAIEVIGRLKGMGIHSIGLVTAHKEAGRRGR